MVEVDEGRHAAAAPITFGELLDRWLDVKRRLVEPKTIESYEWVARKYIRPALADRKVASLRPINLDGLYRNCTDGVCRREQCGSATRCCAKRWSRLAAGG